MKKINHQLNQLKPTWKVKHLFIGTFNPECGIIVPYFYGRDKNLFWQILSEIFQENFNPNSPEFFTLIEKHGIACIDIIKEVRKKNNEDFLPDELSLIAGKGYSDSKIINSKIARVYNTEEIQTIINTSNCNVYSTWGKGSNLKEWKNEILKISFTANLVSPSPVARVPKGTLKKEYIFNDWKSKIII
jgi:hypothetical protein